MNNRRGALIASQQSDDGMAGDLKTASASVLIFPGREGGRMGRGRGRAGDCFGSDVRFYVRNNVTRNVSTKRHSRIRYSRGNARRCRAKIKYGFRNWGVRALVCVNARHGHHFCPRYRMRIERATLTWRRVANPKRLSASIRVYLRGTIFSTANCRELPSA